MYWLGGGGVLCRALQKRTGLVIKEEFRISCAPPYSRTLIKRQAWVEYHMYVCISPALLDLFTHHTTEGGIERDLYIWQMGIPLVAHSILSIMFAVCTWETTRDIIWADCAQVTALLVFYKSFQGPFL